MLSIKSALELAAIILLLWGFSKEDKVISFEQKAWKYIKAFFLVLKEEVKHV